MKYKVIKVTSKESGTSKDGKAWQKIGVLVKENEGDYPKELYLETMTDNMVNAVSTLKVGEIITPSFNVFSRTWTDKAGNTKYFTTASIWKFERDGLTHEPKKEEPKQTTVKTASVEYNANADDLPF